MRYRSWFIAVGLASAGLTIWLPAGKPPTALFASESHKQSADDDQGDWHAPLTINNPYLAPLGGQFGTVAGASVDADLQPLYRLPSLDEEVAVAPSPADEEDEEDLASADEDTAPAAPEQAQSWVMWISRWPKSQLRPAQQHRTA